MRSQGPAWVRSVSDSLQREVKRRVYRPLKARFREHTYERALGSGRVTVGRMTYGEPDIVVYEGDTNRVIIGSFTSIGDKVAVVVGGNHRADWVSTYAFRLRLELPGALSDGLPESRGDVHIGNDVWIGRGATILSGVQISDGAVVGAGAVVSRDVRPYAVVVGNPAREVRRRFPDEQIEALARIAWWNWPLERILEEVSTLCSPAIGAFIEKWDPRLTSPGR